MAETLLKEMPVIAPTPKELIRPPLSGSVPADPHRPDLVWLVAAAVAQLQLDLAAVPFAAALGRVRCVDLFHRVAALLVYGSDSRSGHNARPGEEQVAPDSLRP